MTARLITMEEAEVLKSALLERGELTFPLGTLASGLLSGTCYRIQKNGGDFVPRFRTRLFARLSEGYASVLAFIIWVGPKNVQVWSDMHEESFKPCIRVKLIPNKALKCDPSGPDAAALRRLI